MKRMHLLLLSLIVLTCASAQAGGLGLFYGYMKTDDLDSSGGPGAKIELSLSSWVGLQARAMYMEDFTSGVADLGTDLELSVIPAEFGLRIDIPIADRARPYVGFGGGYYNIELDNENDFDDASFDLDDQVGWYGEIGLQFPINPQIDLFVDAQFRQIEGSFKIDEFSRIRNEEFDLDLSGWGATAGLLWNW